jgi:hypothetical protein
MKMDALFEQDYLPAEENRRRANRENEGRYGCTIGSGSPRKTGAAA